MTDTTFEDKWANFWKKHGHTFSPDLPKKHRTRRNFLRMVREEERNESYTTYFINRFNSILSKGAKPRGTDR